MLRCRCGASELFLVLRELRLCFSFISKSRFCNCKFFGKIYNSKMEKFFKFTFKIILLRECIVKNEIEKKKNFKEWSSNRTKSSLDQRSITYSFDRVRCYHGEIDRYAMYRFLIDHRLFYQLTIIILSTFIYRSLIPYSYKLLWVQNMPLR